MRAWLCLFLIGCGQLDLWDGTAPAVALGQREAELTTEFRLPLTEAGFRTLERAWRWEPNGEREDVYFDVFDGSRFVLKYRPDPIKVRLKRREGDTEWQISHVVGKSQVPGALPVMIATTEAWEGSLGDKDTRKLLERSQAFFDLLPKGGAPLFQAADAVKERWPKTQWPGDDILAAWGVNAHELLPAATNRKSRLATELRLQAGAMEVVLGVTQAVDERGRAVRLFEVEAEPAGPIPPAQAGRWAAQFAEALKKSGLTPAMVGQKSPDAFGFTASRLRGYP